MITVKTDLENKIKGFQFEAECSVSNHEGFNQDRDMFIWKDCDLSVWCKCRNCSTMKTEKECVCFQDMEPVQGIFRVYFS